MKISNVITIQSDINSNQILDVSHCVSLIFVLCILYILSLCSIYTPFHEKTSDTSTKIWQSLANAMIMLCVIVVMTIVLVLLYKYKFYKVGAQLTSHTNQIRAGITGHFTHSQLKIKQWTGERWMKNLASQALFFRDISCLSALCASLYDFGKYSSVVYFLIASLLLQQCHLSTFL